MRLYYVQFELDGGWGEDLFIRDIQLPLLKGVLAWSRDCPIAGYVGRK